MSKTPKSKPQGKITLFLMTEKGHFFLREMAPRFSHMFSQVVIGRDSAIAGDYADEISATCNSFGIPSVPRSKVGAISTQYAMAVSWRWMINHPPERLVVFHDSPLPKYRGFAPLVNALVNGERTIGVTALFGDSEYDVGDILAQHTSNITYPIRIQEAIELNLENYRQCALSVLERIDRGEILEGIPQEHQEASYGIWRDDDDYAIDWLQSSEEIRRFIDAVGYPYRGAITWIGQQKVRITRAVEFPDVQLETRHVGKVLFVRESLPVVICGRGLLQLTDGYLEDDTGARRSLLPLGRFRTRFSK